MPLSLALLTPILRTHARTSYIILIYAGLRDAALLYIYPTVPDLCKYPAIPMPWYALIYAILLDSTLLYPSSTLALLLLYSTIL